MAAAVAAASKGSPLAVVDLAIHVVEAGGRASVEESIGARLTALPEHALQIVEIAAVWGASIERDLLFEAAGAGLLGEEALVSLAAVRLLRVTACGAGGVERVAIYDDRVRAVVVSRIEPAEVRRLNLELGHVLAARPGSDPAAPAACYERAGAPELCVAHLRAAADRAGSARDHDRAAALLTRALLHAPLGAPTHRALLAQRADALAAAGRSAEAAGALLESAAGAARAEALASRLRAAEHLLVAGHFDRGMGELIPVLEAHGVHWPETPRRALWALPARRLELRLRGTALLEGVRPGNDLQSAPGRVEALWSAGQALAMIDPLRSALFLVEARLAALAASDVEHAALAVALSGSMLASQGSAADEAHGLALIDDCARLARRRGDAYLAGFAWFCSGLARLSAGRFREALSRIDEALGMLQERGGDLAWVRHAHRVACLSALLELGALRERKRRAETWLLEARAVGDPLAEAQAALASSLAILAGGTRRAPGSRHRPAARSWKDGFGLPQYAALVVEVSSLLYEGDTCEARARLLAAWPALRASQILRLQLVRVEALRLRGLTTLGAGGPDRHRLARADAARLARERRPHALAAAAVLRAGLARSAGEIATAAASFDEAARGYASAEMSVQAASARRAQGALLGGVEGRTMVAEADALLAEQGIADGARWAGMLTGLGK